jgi:hypothetical protein
MAGRHGKRSTKNPKLKYFAMRLIILFLLLSAMTSFGQAPSGHPGVEFITPAGDPIKSPKNSGDGQNEFTFSETDKGELKIQFKASDPSKGDPQHPYQYKFEMVDQIGDSKMEWDSGYDGGKAKEESSHKYEAKVTFTNLPKYNSGFGKKVVKFLRKKEGEKDYVEMAKQNFEVFFPRNAKNHGNVGLSTKDEPNWFYYWMQEIQPDQIVPVNYFDNPPMTAIPGSVGHTVYAELWSYAGRNEPSISIYKTVLTSNKQYGVGLNYSGIDFLALTYYHEIKHVYDYTEADNLLTSKVNEFQFGWSWRTEPPVHDNHYNVSSSGFMTVLDAYDPNQKDYPLPFGIPNPKPVNSYWESRAINYSANIINKDDLFLEKDWSDPGKQHKDKKWDD